MDGILIKMIHSDPNTFDKFIEHYFAQYPVAQSFQQILDSFTAANPTVCFKHIITGEIVSESPSNALNQPKKTLLSSIASWKKYAKNRSKQLEVVISRQNVLSDAVKAYKTFQKISRFVTCHLFFLSLKVTFEGEEGDDFGGLTSSEFFTLFFTEMIKNSGLFSTNPEGSVVFTDGIKLNENVLDLYEAFGFYLAKAYQIGHPIGCALADVLIKMLRTGRLTDLVLNDLMSYDKQFTLSLNNMLQLSEEELAEFNFKDISPKFVSTQVTRKNVKSFLSLKARDYYRKKFQAQMLMVTLGFVRGCPGGLLSKELADSIKSDIFGSSALSYSIDEFIEFCETEKFHENSDVFLGFFVWLSEIDDSKKMDFLRFLTGLNYVPLGGLKAISPGLKIRVQGSKDQLPSANTCLHILYVPPYESSLQLKDKFNKLMEMIESKDAFQFGFK